MDVKNRIISTHEWSKHDDNGNAVFINGKYHWIYRRYFWGNGYATHFMYDPETQMEQQLARIDGMRPSRINKASLVHIPSKNIILLITDNEIWGSKVCEMQPDWKKIGDIERDFRLD